MFKILGKIAVDGVDKANKDLTTTTNTAKKTTSAFDKVGKSITNAFKKAKFEATGLSLERLTTRVTTQQNKVELLKRKYADLVLQHKKLSPEAIKTAAEIHKLSSAMEKNKGKISKAEEAADKFDKSVKKVGDDSEKTAEKTSSAFSKIASVAGKVLVAGVAAASAAIVALGKSSIENYANYEQLVGGVKTLFGAGDASLEEYAKSVGKSVNDAQREYRILMDAQKEVFTNANNAYKTAGLSANEYMETVTSFSASLIQSLGGDTRAAAQYADMAITDMSDNANKMGTDMESIQNAYQGFAKQNYTMLDNLKLGYGGTKEEMERLLQDADALSDSFNLATDTNGDLVYSYADIVDAIHVVQTEMGITGATQEEAATTIQGSVSSMKSAWQNFVTGLADDNADLDQLMGNLIDSVVTVGDNLIPRIQTLLPRIATGLTTLASSVAQQLPGIMQTVVPSLLTSAASLVVSLVQGITATLPTLIPVAVEAILTITTGLLEMLPEITQAAFDIITELGSGLVSAFPQLLSTVVSTLVTLLPQLISGCVSLIVSLCAALPTIIQPIIEALPTIIISVVNALMENLPSLIDGAVQLVVGLVAALPTIILALLNALPDIIVSVTNGLIGALPTLIAGVGSIITAVVAAVWAFLSGFPETVSNFVTTIWANISTVMTGVWETIKTTISTTINTIWTIISTVFTGIVTTVTTLINSVLTTVTSVFDSIKTTITDKIEAAKTAVSTAIEAIKGFFNFEWSLPSIKLPHFSISGSFSLNPPSIPTFGVDWYAKGGVLEEPTIFGVNGNSLMGGGEAGKEAVAPINVLQGYVADAVASQTSGIAEALERMAATLDAILGAVRDVDMDGMTIDLNRREFGRLVRAVT